MPKSRSKSDPVVEHAPETQHINEVVAQAIATVSGIGCACGYCQDLAHWGTDAGEAENLAPVVPDPA